jgi:hypothetical protein
MNPEFVAAYNAFQSINQHFARKSSRLSRIQVGIPHTAQGRLQQVYNKLNQQGGTPTLRGINFQAGGRGY